MLQSFTLALDLLTLWLLLAFGLSGMLALLPAPRGDAKLCAREWRRRLFVPPSGAAALVVIGYGSAWLDAWADLPEPCGTAAQHMLFFQRLHPQGGAVWAPHELVLLAVLALSLLVTFLGLVRGLRAQQALGRLCGLAKPARAHDVERLLAAAGLTFPGPILVLEVQVPLCCVVGVVRPRLILSSLVLEQSAPTHLTAMLAHECAHAARRDNLWRLIGRGLSFFHLPGTGGRFMDRWSEASEMACDQAARDLVGPIATAEALLGYQRLLNRSLPLGLGAAFEGSGRLEARVRSVLAPPAPARRNPLLAFWPWLLLLGMLHVNGVHLGMEVLLHAIHQ